MSVLYKNITFSMTQCQIFIGYYFMKTKNFVFYRFRYFPIQNLLKIFASKSSSEIFPVIVPK